MAEPSGLDRTEIDAEAADHPAPVAEGRSVELILLVDRLCDRFEAAWAAGEQPRIEAYLAEADEAGRPALLRELLATELAIRRSTGERPDLEDYRARFPGAEAALRAAFASPGGAGASASVGAAEPGRPDEPTMMMGEAVAPAPGPDAGPPSRWPNLQGYEIEAELGRGGMGVVYKAREVRLNRPVAVKMILAADAAGAEALVRFLAEAEMVARLQHPNISQIYALGDQDGRPFFVMEYAGGGSLSARLDGTPWPARDAARLIAILARAIHEAHRLGIVHRDLKPANVLLAADGTPKITDFGLAKCLGSDSGLTRTEVVMGSPSYMAPEQAEGLARAAGPATDVYALGAIFYELLTGRPPFKGASVLQTLEQVRGVEPVPPTRLQPATPRDAETICLRCLGKAPDRRYASAEALADDLDRFLQGKSILARRAGPARRTWLWCRRNPAVAGLAAASALLMVLLAAGATAAALGFRRQRDDLRAAGERAERAEARQKLELVESLLTATPDAVPYLLAGLGPARGLARPVLRHHLDDPAAPPLHRLRAAEALTILGEPHPRPLLEGIATAPGGECGNLVAALKTLGAPAPAELRRRGLVERALATRARLAIAALFLGDPGPARRMLAIRPDPVERSAFLRAFESWHGDPAALPGLLRSEADPAFRSGLCAALAGIEPGSLAAPDRDALSETLRGAYRAAPDAATHAAAEYALRRWGLPLPPIGPTRGPVAGRDWYVNGAGLTMVEFPPAAFLMGRDGRSPGYLVVVTGGFFLADREVTADLFRAFVADPGTPAARKPAGWTGPDLAISPAGDCPVDAISPEDAILFCNWLSRREGLASCYDRAAGPDGGWSLVEGADGYRLPTAEEFAYAFRAGSATRFPTGDDADGLAEAGVIAQVRTFPAGSRPPNDRGLFDMIGNLWEACWAVGTDGRVAVQMRGGAYDSGSFDCHPESSHPLAMQVRNRSLGFRVARGAAGPATPPARMEGLLGKLAGELESQPGMAASATSIRELILRDWRIPDDIRQERWGALADDYARLGSAHPENHWLWWQGALAEAQAGRLDAYRGRCREMLTVFQDTPAWNIAEQMAKTALVVPNPADIVERACRLAGRAAGIAPESPWTLYTSGLSEYRSGRFASALERLRFGLDRDMEIGRPFLAPYRFKNLVVQALASARLGRWEDARFCLDRADAILRDATPAGREPSAYLETWRDWVHGQILRREAEGLMLDRGFPADPFAR